MAYENLRLSVIVCIGLRTVVTANCQRWLLLYICVINV